MPDSWGDAKRRAMQAAQVVAVAYRAVLVLVRRAVPVKGVMERRAVLLVLVAAPGAVVGLAQFGARAGLAERVARPA